MVKFILLMVVGFLMGIFTIVLGGGAGAVYVSLLTLLFNVPPAIATSTSLATMFPTAGVSAFLHAKSNNVNFKTGWIMMGWGAIGSLIGSSFSGKIPEDHYNQLIGWVIIGLTVLMAVKKIPTLQITNKKEASRIKRVLQASLFGMIGGILSGLVGTSGTTAIIAGLAVLGCSTMQTVGTSVFVLSGISLSGFLMRVQVGNVAWKLAIPLAVSAVLGAILGSLLLKKVIVGKTASKDNKGIDLIMILGNLLMGIALLFK